MNRISKMYRLKNGYGIVKCECYDGYNMQYFWTIWNPEGRHYMNCGSYEEAYEIAKNLKGEIYEVSAEDIRK